MAASKPTLRLNAPQATRSFQSGNLPADKTRDHASPSTLPMHLFCCFTPAHRILYEEVFAPSLPRGFQVHPTLIEEPGKGDFLSPEFLRCIRQKLTLIRDSLENHQGQILIWSDVDIRFVNLTPQSLIADFHSTNSDIAFQRESPHLPDVNTGFFICRANPTVGALFHRVQALLAEKPAINEQMAMNQLLAGPNTPSTPTWSHLPRAYYARTHGWPPPTALALYHANYTKGPNAIGQKLAQFRELETLLQGGWPARILSIAKRIPGKILPKQNS
jgi:hypothetical protein